MNKDNVIIGIFIIGLLSYWHYNESAVAVTPHTEAQENGRYQLTSGNNNPPLLLDTKTGLSWLWYSNQSIVQQIINSPNYTVEYKKLLTDIAAKNASLSGFWIPTMKFDTIESAAAYSASLDKINASTQNQKK